MINRMAQESPLLAPSIGTAPMIAFIQAILGAYRLCAKLLIAGAYNSIDEKNHSNRFIDFVNVICFQVMLPTY